MMSTVTKLKMLILIAVTITFFDIVSAFGQSHFPYRPRNRGQYSEGQRGERPISNIVVKLKALSAIPAGDGDADSQIPSGDVNLAFRLPEGMGSKKQKLDITIEGPRDYLLDRVAEEFTGGMNVFSWNSEVIDGLGLTCNDLDPRVNLIGEMYFPCLLYQGSQAAIPNIESYRALLETNIEGILKYSVRGFDSEIISGEFAVIPRMPVEILIPAITNSHHIDLYVRMEYETESGARSVRKCFPIQSFHQH